MPLCLEDLNRPNEILLAYFPYQIYLMINKEHTEMESMNIEKFLTLIKKTNWIKSENVKQVFERTILFSEDILSEHNEGKTGVDITKVGRAIKLVSHLLTPTEKKAFIQDIHQFTLEIIKRLEKKTADKEKPDLKKNSILDMVETYFKNFNSQNTLKKRLIELPIEIFYLVAKADGVLDKKERKTFLKILKNRSWSQSRITEAFFPHSILHYEELEKKQATDQIKANLKEIQKTMKIIQGVFKTNEIRLFRSDLFKLAMEIANASGGILGISKVADDEQEVLNNLRFAFRG